MWSITFARLRQINNKNMKNLLIKINVLNLLEFFAQGIFNFVGNWKIFASSGQSTFVLLYMNPQGSLLEQKLRWHQSATGKAAIGITLKLWFPDQEIGGITDLLCNLTLQLLIWDLSYFITSCFDKMMAGVGTIKILRGGRRSGRWGSRQWSMLEVRWWVVRRSSRNLID